MTDQQPHTPTIEKMRKAFAISHWDVTNEYKEGERLFDEQIAAIEAAAEQRGAARAFRKTQEIIAGFDHTIEEARNRDDMINTGYLIIEIDAEIQDLLEGDE